MNKPLLQWKREIEEEIKKWNTSSILESEEYKGEPKRLERICCCENQLQMIDDIIEQVEKFNCGCNASGCCIYQTSMARELLGE